MTDEIKLAKERERGAQARSILEHDLVKESFDVLEKEYLQAWRLSHIRDSDARERLFIAVNIVHKVKDHLSTIIQNGKLAERQLADIAQRQEIEARRNKR